jgi:protein-disulfide isomerase
MEVRVKRGTTLPVLGILVMLALAAWNGSLLSARSEPLAQGDSASLHAAIGLAAITSTPQPPPGGSGSTRDNPLLNPCTGQPFTTIMTGAGLQNVEAQAGGTNANQYVISFSLADSDEARRFSQHTATHIGQALAIVLDGQVLSAPVVQAALTTGGIITGNFTRERAQELALQLRYGALPVSLVVKSSDAITGGLRIVLAAAPDAPADADRMEQARQIISRRMNALGLVDPVVQLDSANQIVIELREVTDSQALLKTLKTTALLEFVDFSRIGSCTAPMPVAGQYILTDKQISLGLQPMQAATAAPAATATPETQGPYSQIPQATTTDGAAILGDPAAKVIFVEFGDYSCPHCRDYQPIMHQVIDQYVRTGQARLIFRPLTFVGGSYSVLAAQAALCAGKQGHYWDMHDALYELQASRGIEAFTLEEMRATADNMGINGSEVAACIERGDTAATLDSSDQLSMSLNVTGVPAILYSTDGSSFNWLTNPDTGEPITGGGPPLASFTRIIQQFYPTAQ